MEIFGMTVELILERNKFNTDGTANFISVFNAGVNTIL
jgi:hypothetical protein